jgi:hypothetical protein
LGTIAVASSLAAADISLDELLDRLSAQPVKEAVLTAIERKRLDPRTKAALVTAFASASSKREKQSIAVTMAHLDVDTDGAVDYLMGPAREAIEDPAPSFIKYDSSGNSLRGQLAPAFENWCAVNHKDWRALVLSQLYEEPDDVLMLVRANSLRSLELLRKGLLSNNMIIVGYSAQGLARIHDTGSVAKVAEVVARLPQSSTDVVARQLPWYGTVDADALMAKLMPDLNIRTFYVRQVRSEQSFELAIITERAAASARR